MKSWLKKPKNIAIVTVIGILFFAIIVPLIINGLYQINGPIVTEWDCGDTLLFYGAVLGATGTIVLGIVSVYQNIKAQELNERVENSNKELQRLTEAQFVSFVSLGKHFITVNSSEFPRFHNAAMPEIDVIDLTDKQLYSKKASFDCYHIDCEIKNNSDYAIVQIDYKADAASRIHGLCDVLDRAIYISPHSSTNIRFIVPKICFDSYQHDGFKAKLMFTNVFDYHSIGIINIDNLNSPSSKVDFRLAKITDVKPKEDTQNGQT